MITYEIENFNRFNYQSDTDVEVILEITSEEKSFFRQSNLLLKSNINYFTEIKDDYTDKTVVFYDKSKKEKFLEFILPGEKRNIINHNFDYNKITRLYIDLLKKSLIDYIDLDNSGRHDKIEGRNLYPTNASKTMIGLKALNNIEYCINQINMYNIEGDFIETGVWRGGATIFMKALSDIFSMNRQVWVADAFEESFPKSDNSIDIDEEWQRNVYDPLKVTLAEVTENFKKYNMLDENVRFLKGWFKDTLDTPEIKKLSLLRLDGDMYSSTMQSLITLYPKLQKGGYIIVDDYYSLDECRTAVNDYRKTYNITEEIIRVNWQCVYWKKI